MLGKATRLMDQLAAHTKTYTVTASLGTVTDTLDANGRVLEQKSIPPDLNPQIIERALTRFTGVITQKVPRYSAVRLKGKRLYTLARRGEHITQPERKVYIEQITLRWFAPPKIELRVTCGKGTYIRQLVADLGDTLGCGAHVSALRRNRVGPFVEQAAYRPVQLEKAQQNGTLEDYLLSLCTAVAHLPSVTVTTTEAQKLACGQSLTLSPPALSDDAGDCVAVISEGGKLAALAEWKLGRLQPKKVFV
jgi:tRNA pseudouridine55 synthase